jgi:hypothetical protein
VALKRRVTKPTTRRPIGVDFDCCSLAFTSKRVCVAHPRNPDKMDVKMGAAFKKSWIRVESKPGYLNLSINNSQLPSSCHA